MKAMDLLETIGDVNDNYIREAHSRNRQRTGRISRKRQLVIAALVAVMLMLVGCAVWMHLRQMKVGDWEYEMPNRQVEGAVPGETITNELISLQGFVGSKGYQAALEWNEFLENYDVDGSLLKEVDDANYFAPERYEAYGCYTQDMIDKVDEICTKYQLQMLGEVQLAEDVTEIFDVAGIENVITEEAGKWISLYADYYYKDGTFLIGGDVCMDYEDSPWPYPFSFQYRSVKKDSFDTVYLAVGELADYEEWNYTLKDGTEVLLALSPEQALMIVEKEERFVTVNIISPYIGDILLGELHMDKSGLEAFAELFTFSGERSGE